MVASIVYSMPRKLGGNRMSGRELHLVNELNAGTVQNVHIFRGGLRVEVVTLAAQSNCRLNLVNAQGLSRFVVCGKVASNLGLVVFPRALRLSQPLFSGW